MFYMRQLSKDLLYLALVAAPSILLAGYTVFRLRSVLERTWELPVSDFQYSLALMTVMISVYWITSRRAVRRIKRALR